MPTINFFWDEVSDNVLVETDQNNQVVTTYIQRPEKFGKVLYHKQGNDFAYYHYDGSGSTRTLTDNTQSVTKTYIFSGYGELIASPGAGSTPFAYKGAVGYYTNSATGDIYVRARTYQPVTGRWLSKDPLGVVDGPNLYRAYFVPQGVDMMGMSLDIFTKPDSIIEKYLECPRCCCCAENIVIPKHGIGDIVPNPPLYTLCGNFFTVIISLEYVQSLLLADCRLDWGETITFDGDKPLPPLRPGHTIGFPTDLVDIDPTSPTFNPWWKKPFRCPGALTVSIYDPPAVNTRPLRKVRTSTIHFDIVVYSAEGCICSKPRVWITAKQVVEIENGVCLIHSFETPDPDFP